MKKFYLSALLVISLSSAVLPKWIIQDKTDINAIIKKAEFQHKMVVLFFDQKDCPWCEKMVRQNFSGSELTKKTKDNFLVVHIDNDGNREVKYKNFLGSEKKFKDMLRVYFSPTMIFLDKKGDIIKKFDGYRNPEKYRTILDYILSGAYKKMKYIEFYNEYQFSH